MPGVINSVRRARLLVALATAQLLVALDFSIIYVALPSIGRSLDFSAAALQWVVSAYSILFAGLLLFGGQLADRFGGGRIFLAGQLLFAVASAAAAASPDSALLIVTRAVQGAAAALIVPSTLALLNETYPSGPSRNRALSVWGTTGAMGLALGVSAGGLTVKFASWRGVFWINLPIVAICLATAGPTVLRTRARTGQRLTPVAAILASVCVITIVFTFTELARTAPSVPLLVAGMLVATVTAAVFIGLERRSAYPLIPREVLRVTTVRVGCLAAALYMASFGAEFYLVTVYLQDQRHYTPLHAGLAFLPLAATIVAGNTITGALASRWTLARLLPNAYIVDALGLMALAIGVTTSFAYPLALLPGLLVSGLGQGMAFTGMFVMGTRDLPETSNGIGSALVTTAQYTGGAIGLAVLVIVLGHNPNRATFAVGLALTAVLALIVAPVARAKLQPAATSRPKADPSPGEGPARVGPTSGPEIAALCGRRGS